MKLNLDCLRDILLCIEEQSMPHKALVFIDTYLAEKVSTAIESKYSVHPYQAELSAKYSNDELIYHLVYCLEAELLISNSQRGATEIFILDLSVKGHEFLDTLRSPTLFEKLKQIAVISGKYSVPALSQIGGRLLNDYLATNHASV